MSNAVATAWRSAPGSGASALVMPAAKLTTTSICARLAAGSASSFCTWPRSAASALMPLPSSLSASAFSSSRVAAWRSAGGQARDSCASSAGRSGAGTSWASSVSQP
jgi:hypothetical protein